MVTLSHISPIPTPDYSQTIEIVERKGIGHPDTICDALAKHSHQKTSKAVLH